MERMSTLDAGFFFVEHRNVPMHLGSLMVFEGPASSYRDVVGLFAGKLPLVPRCRSQGEPGSCATWRGRSSRSGLIAIGRCGRRGSLRASKAAAGR